MQEILMTAEDVSWMRLLGQAQSQAFRVVQDIKTRNVVLHHSSSAFVTCADVENARSWLRQYAECSVFARRCFVDRECVCSVHRL